MGATSSPILERALGAVGLLGWQEDQCTLLPLLCVEQLLRLFDRHLARQCLFRLRGFRRLLLVLAPTRRLILLRRRRFVFGCLAPWIRLLLTLLLLVFRL